MLVAALLAVMVVSATSHAQSNLPTYSQLVIKNNLNESIPVGTKINAQNWEKYKGFMSEGMKMLWGQNTAFKLPPNYYIVVGPTRPIPTPVKYAEDTEKYSGNVQLVPFGNQGVYILKNYVTGQPFPNPKPPHMGQKVFYNWYYRYQPTVEYGHGPSLEIDRLGNKTDIYNEYVNHRLMHGSDIGYPINWPNNNGVFFCTEIEQLEPDEGRYTTVLNLLLDDPNKIDQHYIYVPAIRRHLRLSSAARCAPLTGGDLTNDDLRQGMEMEASTVLVKYLGAMKLLSLVHMNANFAEGHGQQNFLWPGGWPKQSLGDWELRTVDVIDVTRLPQDMPGYCYSHRVAYIDRQTNMQLALDLYDSAGRLWKAWLDLYHPHKLPKNGGVDISGACGGVERIYDFQEGHETWSPFIHCVSNQDVPKAFQSMTRWCTPGGLDQIMQ